MKKIKGGYSISVSEDGDFLLSTIQNKVYVYDAKTCNCLAVYKVFSNISYAVMSHNGKMIAAKNTSGKIAVLSYPSGEVLGMSAMEKEEGFDSLCFSKDDSRLFDFDWAGDIMELDLSTFQHWSKTFFVVETTM